MAKKAEIIPEAKAREFITGSKDVFKSFIPRDKIDEVAVADCTEKDGAFDLTGSVGTTSPTGKEKTFKFTAVVRVDEEGTASLCKLQVSEL